MSDSDWVRAARLALPEEAHLTGISLIQELGLDYGPRKPIHFVVAGDLHLAFEGVFLHRTKALAPLEEGDVCVEAAFMSYCVRCRVIDAIKVGDWLLHNQHMDLGRLEALATAHPWRDGAYEALWVFEHLDPDSWSLMESETRAVLVFAGLRGQSATNSCPRSLPVSSFRICSTATTASRLSSRACSTRTTATSTPRTWTGTP